MTVFLAAAMLASCETTRKEGDWDDIIKLSADNVEFDGSGGTVDVATQGDWWWITEYVEIDGEAFYANVDGSDVTAEYGKIKGWDNPNVAYDPGADLEIKKMEGPWFTVTKGTYTNLTVDVDPNTSGSARSVRLHFQAGNYFDSITINQTE